MSLFTLQTSDQQQYGPVELQTLRVWAREGRIEKDNIIYDHTRLKWIEACKLPQIMEFFQLNQMSPPSTGGTKPQDPFAKTVAEDPLSRIEKQIAAQIETSKAGAVPLPSKKLHGAGNKFKLQQEPAHMNTGNHPTKPPTVLDRISRIFLGPFAKKKEKAETSKKNHKN